MEGDYDHLPSDEVDIGGRAKDGSLNAAEDDLNTSRGSPILNTPTLGLKNRIKARRKNQQVSISNEESVVNWPVSCDSVMKGENYLQSDFVVPKTPIQRGALQNSVVYCESDSEDMFASDTSDCDDTNIPSNLNALINIPESSNLSWTSSMATPVANNVTWSNLNTEERKVLLPSEDCDILGVKPRALFTPDLSDIADCHSLNNSSDIESLMAHRKEMSDTTPKLLQRKSSTGHKVFIDSPLVTNAVPNNVSASSQQTDEIVEKVTTGSPILSGSSEYKRTPVQYKEMYPGEEDLFGNVESLNIISCSQTAIDSKNCSAAESTPNSEHRRRSPPNTVEESTKSENTEVLTGKSSETASRAQKRENSAVSTPGKHLDAKRRRLLFSSNDNTLSSPKSVFKVPEAKLTDEAMPNCSEDTADELIPDDSFSEHLAAMNTSIFSDPIAPVTKVQAIKSSASHMKKFCYTLSEQKSELDGIKDCSSSKPEPLMKEIVKSILSQETLKEVTMKDKSVTPSGELIAFSQLLRKEEDFIENPPETSVMTGIAMNLSTYDVLMDSKTEGFQTASGHSIQISQEALSKGLHCLEGAMEDIDIKSVKISPIIACSRDNSSTISKQSCIDIKSKSLKDEEILQAEEEVKQLLQLVKSGEEFDPWHENEQPLQVNHEESKVKAANATLKKATFSAKSGSDNKDKTSELELGSPGFATAGGRNIFISKTNLAKAQKLFEYENEPVDLIMQKDLKFSKTFAAENNPSTSVKDAVNFDSDDACVLNHQVLHEYLIKTQSVQGTEDKNPPICEEKGLVLFGEDRHHTENSGPESSNARCENSSVSSTSAVEESEMRISNEALSFLNRLMDNPKKESFSAPKCEKSIIVSGAEVKTRNASEEVSSEARHPQGDLLGNGDTAAGFKKLQTLSDNANSPKGKICKNNSDDYHVLVTPEAKAPMLSKSEATSFSTASGKSVIVSKQALKKVESLFDDLADECLSHAEVNDRKSSVNLNCDIEKVGLPTSAKHKVPVKKMTKTEKLTPSKITFQSKSNSAYITSNVKRVVPKNSLPSVQQDEDNCSTETVLLSESSAEKLSISAESGRTVNVSQESLKKLKVPFHNLSSVAAAMESSTGMNVVEEDFVAGFSTASGKFVSVAKEALKKAKKIFDGQSFEDSRTSVESETFQYEEGSDRKKNQMLGFCTANGKTVSVSEDAMKKVEGLFDAEVTSLDLQTLFSTESCKTKRSDAPNVESNCNGSDRLSVEMAGFSTAGGKTVRISKEALNKAKRHFDDLNFESPMIVLESSKLEESQSQVPSSSECHQNDSISSNLSLKMAGFATAGGRDVFISKEALSKAKHLFDDFESESSVILPENTICQKSGVVGVQSSDAKPRASSNLSVKMSGFSTAGGKEVHISKEALSRAKTLFIDDLSKDKNLLVNKSNNTTDDDSGVFLSHENTPSELSVNRSSTLLSLPKKLPSTPHFANKENWSAGQSSVGRYTDTADVQKESLTQEISESTAALLADEADSFANSLQSICTSPSMATDRCSHMKPILTSASGNKLELDEPTSPILVKNDNKRRSRRGRLSLSSISGRGSISPTLGSQSTASHSSLRKFRGSVPESHPNGFTISTCPGAVSEGCKDLRVSDQGELSHISQSVASLQPFPLRKLFVDDIASSLSTEVLPQNGVAKEKTLAEAFPQSPKSPENDAQQISKSSHSVPLVKRVLSRNLSAQPSGFKTPYKQANKDQQKRTPPSPLSNPPEAKRRKPSTNLYVSHIHGSSLERPNFGTRILRSEVEEMRRRAAEEQKQLTENYAELKGEFLEPCTGGWLAAKTSGGNPMMKLSQLGLPATFLSDDLIKIGLRPSTVTITSENATKFRFSAWDYYSEDMCRENVAGIPVGDGAFLVLDSAGTAGVEEVERSLLASPGVDPSLVPPGWIKNNYRWLVWKLAAYEWRFPYRLGQRCLSPHILMLQLKYRYDREIDRCERPALRRIFEHDDSAAKRMVLCVASIVKPKDDTQSGNGLELELTDGWYSAITSIDQDMQHRVRKGIIRIGTKLVTHGAELINCPDGCSPLQARPEVRLKIYSNSTRRSQWHVKLGFQDNPGPIRIGLSSILSGGGVIGCVSAYVARVYPIIFMQKTEERTVVRSQRAESKEVAKCEKKRQQEAELVYSKVQAEVQLEQSKRRPSSVKLSLKYVSTLTSGEDLTELLENSSDPLSVESMLTEDQKNIVSDYQQRKQEELCHELDNRVRQRLSENSQHDRNVTPILKIRLIDSTRGKQHNCAMLSVYRPSEDISSFFKEGQKLSIFGAAANGLRCGELQLSANRSTRYNENTSAEIIPGLARRVTPLNFLLSHGFLPRFGELDIVGIIVRVAPAPRTSENPTHFQTVYISDSQLNIIGISFREGVKEFGVEDLLVPHSPIVASNLQWRGGSVVRALPCVFASELSAFTSNPRQKYCQTALNELRSSLHSDLKSFCHNASEKLDLLLKPKAPMATGCPTTPDPLRSVLKQEDVSSKNQNSSVQNLSLVNTPTMVKGQQNLSVEEQLITPSHSTSLSPAVQKKIAKLEIYGEAPPISPIIVSQPRRLRKSFKPPRRTDSPLADSKKS